MKRKALVFLTAAAVALVALPGTGVVGAVQGTLDLVQPTAGFPFATTAGRLTTERPLANQIYANLVKFRATDPDLNVNSQLPASSYTTDGRRYEILGTADPGFGAGSFVMGTLPNALEVAFPPIGDQTGDGVVNFNDVVVRNLQSTNVITPEQVNSASGTITLFTDAPGGLHETRLDVGPFTAAVPAGFTIGTDETTNVVQLSAPSQLYIDYDATSATSDVDIWLSISRIDKEGVATGASPADPVFVLLTLGNGTADAGFLRLQSPISGAGTLDDPLLAEVGDSLFPDNPLALFVSGFRNTNFSTELAGVTNAAIAYDAFTGTLDSLTIGETETIGVNYQFATTNDTDTASGSSPISYNQTVRATSSTNAGGIGLTLFETDTAAATPQPSSATSGQFQQTVVNWSTWTAAAQTGVSVTIPNTDPGAGQGVQHIADGTGIGGIVISVSDVGRRIVGTPTISHKDSLGADVLPAPTVAIDDADGNAAAGVRPTLLVTLGANRVAGDVITVTFNTGAAKSGEPQLAQGIVLISPTIQQQIQGRQVAGSPAAHQFTENSTLTQVLAALNTPAPGALTGLTDAADWVTNSQAALNLPNDTAWKNFLSVVLVANNGDTVTLVYNDANGIPVNRTITVDSAAPTITNLFPVDDGAVNTTTPQLQARISDPTGGTGFDTVNLGQSGGGTPSPAIRTNLDGTPVNYFPGLVDANTFDISVPVLAPLSVAPHTWQITVYDRVGNTATSGVINFDVDNIVPTMLTAETGIGLRLKTGSTTVYEEFRSSEWIKVTMSERVSESSVQAADFSITNPNATPSNTSVQEKVHILGEACVIGAAPADPCEGQDRRSIIYIQVGAALAPNATPTVTINGVLSDRAGNSAPTGTATGAFRVAADRILPVLALTVNPTLGKNDDVISIIVTSNEPLSGGAPLVRVNAVPVAVSSTGPNTWQSTHTIAAQGVHNVTADGQDVANNAATQQTGTFQGDQTPPAWVFNIVDLDGTRAGTQVETDEVIFVPLNGADMGVGAPPPGEYAGDTHDEVTVVSADLQTLDKLTAFGGAAPVVQDTQTLDPSQFQSNNNVNYVLGLTDLPIGFYRLRVSGQDEAGNAQTTPSTVEFEVIAQQPAVVPVNPGWTLVSFPGRPQDTALDVVLADTSITQVWSFNSQTQVWQFARLNEDAGMWEGTLTQMVDGRAYYVRSSTFDPIEVLMQRFSPQRTPPQYPIMRGWNGIGYTPGGNETQATVANYLQSLVQGNDAGWGVIRWWNTTQQRYESAWPNGNFTGGFPTMVVGGNTVPAVQAGQGYLLYATRNGTLAP